MTTAPEPTELYGVAIGDKRAEYYLKRFASFDERGGGFYPSWNWAAFIFGPFWPLYRRLHNHFWLFVVVPLLLVPVVRFSPWLYPPLVGLAWIAFAAYANAFYYRHIRKKIARAQKRSLEGEKLVSFLKSKGGVSYAGPVELIVIAAAFGGLLMLAIPAREDYVVRARVNAAIGEVIKQMDKGSPRKRGVKVYPRGIKSIGPGPGSSMKIVFSGSGLGCERCAALDGLAVLLAPQRRGDTIVWICRSEELPSKYLPSFCRE